MSIDNILSNRNKLDINQFIADSVTLYHHYEAYGNKVVLEWIAVGVASLRNEQQYKNLEGNITNEESFTMMTKYAESHIKERMGKQVVSQLAVGVILGVLSFLLLNQVVNLNFYVSIIAAIVIFFIILSAMIRNTSKTLISTTNALYAENVKEDLQAYFHHYLAQF